MRKKLLTLLIVFTFISVSCISVITFVRANMKEATTYNRKDLVGIDGTPHLQGVVYNNMIPDDGNTWTVNVSDDYYGGVFELDFECIIRGEKANIWIGLDTQVWTDGFQDEYVDDGDGFYGPGDVWYFAYPWSYEGIPYDYSDPGAGYYLLPGYRDWITYENLEYVLSEFDEDDTGIHDKVVEHFGEYADRPGPEGDYKIQILIFNIRDGLFYDPETAPWFIIGYFWSYISDLNNANIFHMDTYQWWRRLGDPDVCPDPYAHLTPLPHQYEGTFAHEFQHLVHHDMDPNEESWVNEGCSMLAEWLCGYGFSPGHMEDYFLWFWDTPLVVWESYLADYGASFLWTFYMYEHYGGAPMIKALVAEQADGIEGWSKILKDRGIRRSFDQIFQDWAIANYLDDTSFCKGRYGYYDLEIGSDDTNGMSIQAAIDFWIYDSGNPAFLFPWRINTYPYEASEPTPIYGIYRGLPYTVNYYEFYDVPAFMEVEFYGAPMGPTFPAYEGVYQWHSGADSYSWYRLGQTFTNLPAGAELTFMSYFDIEPYWDFGYVEVYDITDNEWYTLPGVQTTTSIGYSYEADNPNCPVEFEPTAYFDASRWNGFTGNSGGWYQEVMDLSMFAGHDIELYFTYWTDQNTQGQGWYIDNIEITGVLSDDVEAGEDGWVSTGWIRTDGIIYNDFAVSFIKSTTLTKGNGDPLKTWHRISSMRIDSETETGDEIILSLNNKRLFTTTVMVVANQPGYEHAFGSTYAFTAEKFVFCRWKWFH
ncbi:MAG: hypothetical protein ACFE8B_06335 [Candidatus Hermodarchaeota archaeon]